MPKYIIYNGKLTEDENVKISINDRAFNYGDGLFETLIVSKGRIHFFEDHIQRLWAGFRFLRFNDESFPSQQAIKAQIHTLLSENMIESGRIKINVWRKEGGLFLPQDNNVNYLIRSTDFIKPLKEKTKVVLSPYIVNNKFHINNIKTLNSALYVLSSLHYQSQSANDSLLINSQNEIVELCSSNIFFTSKEDYYTPCLESGCLAGIMRKNVIQYLRKKKINILETKIPFEDLSNFDGCFGSNVAGLFKIKSIENQTFKNKFDLETIENEVYR